MVNPLNPHDALKHHFASLKNNLISRFIERKFSWNFLNNNNIFCSFATQFKSSSSTTSREACGG